MRGTLWKSAGKREKSNRYTGDALCPYKKPKFERGLVKSLKKGGGSKEDES